MHLLSIMVYGFVICQTIGVRSVTLRMQLAFNETNTKTFFPRRRIFPRYIYVVPGCTSFSFINHNKWSH